MAKQQNQTHQFQTFQSPMGTELKVYVREGEPWFVGHEVAEALGYSNTRDALSRHVDSTDKTTVVIPDTGSNYKTSKVLINESGLYSLILSSKLPQAREFKRWVTSVVLPQIRMTGGYIPIGNENENVNVDENENRASSESGDGLAQSLPSREGGKDAQRLNENWAGALSAASREEIIARALLIVQRTLEQKDMLIGVQADVIADMQPKALFHDAVQGAYDAISMSELAKLISQNGVPTGQKRLFRWMRDNGYLGKHHEFWNMPIQRYIEQGLFCVQESVYDDGYGHLFTHRTPKVTGKGQTYFIHKICGC